MEQIEYKTDNATYMIEVAEGNCSATVIVGGDCIGEIRYCGGIFIGSAMEDKYINEFKSYIDDNKN